MTIPLTQSFKEGLELLLEKHGYEKVVTDGFEQWTRPEWKDWWRNANVVNPTMWDRGHPLEQIVLFALLADTKEDAHD